MIYTDLLFFLCVLPFSVLISFFDRSTEYKNLVLIITSLLVFSWGKPFGVCLLFLTTIAEWLLALRIEKNKENSIQSAIPLVFDIVLNLVVFFLFTRKFLYVSEDAFGFAQALTSIGIMFYVLRGFSYIYDVYKGKIKAEKNIFCLLTYMCVYFFMPVGPVVRYGEMEPFIRNRSLTANSINQGLNSFIYGLGKAVILAPVLRKISDTGLCMEDIVGCWTGAVCMLGFAYFLFAGFCDMSWGIAKIYGFDFKKNYRHLGVGGMYEGVIKSCGTSLFEFFEEIISDLSEKYKVLRNPMIIILSALTAVMLNQSLLFLLVGIVIGLIIIFEKTKLNEKIEEMPTWLKFVYTYLVSFVLLGGLFSGGIKGLGRWFVGLIGIGSVAEKAGTYRLDILSDKVKYAFLNNIFIVIIAFLMTLDPLRNLLGNKIEAYSQKSVDNYGKLSIVKTIFTALLFVVCIVVITSANIQI